MRLGRTSSEVGAATRMSKHRLLMGAMSLLVLFAQRMMRMFDMYFSIVLRRAAWASRERESASLMITTADRWMSAQMQDIEMRQILLRGRKNANL